MRRKLGLSDEQRRSGKECDGRETRKIVHENSSMDASYVCRETLRSGEMHLLIPYHDRYEAGRILAGKLRAFADPADLLVLALPRGGVPVAFEVAQSLHAPLDVLIVRK